MVKWFPVAILGAKSSVEAADIFRSNSPAARLSSIMYGESTPVNSAIGKNEQKQIDVNTAMLAIAMGGGNKMSTPMIVYQSKTGEVIAIPGAPKDFDDFIDELK